MDSNKPILNLDKQSKLVELTKVELTKEEKIKKLTLDLFSFKPNEIMHVLVGYLGTTVLHLSRDKRKEFFGFLKKGIIDSRNNLLKLENSKKSKGDKEN